MSETTLWHIAVSHYSEKARWALDWKREPHKLRAPVPGIHMGIAVALTRGQVKTFPVLQIDDVTVGDSARIIATLDERRPDRPLIPIDAEERARALELQSFFDEELGPFARHDAMHTMRGDRAAREAFSATAMPKQLRDVGIVRRGGGVFANTFFRARYGINEEEDAQRARAKVLAAYDRLESELEKGNGSHLVGDEFTVADLTAASLLMPMVAPPEGPDLPEPAPALAEFRSFLSERPGTIWARETFARYRRPSPAG